MENKISVVVCTYNQEDTIARTLDSILMQQCHLPYEIIIGEDCSTDNTLSICQQYAAKHPDIIRLIANQPNKGVVDNYFDCLLAASGKYIADCAGDDFWTDTQKLEKEVTLMEQHPEVTMVLTRWNWYDEHTHRVNAGPPPPYGQSIVNGQDMLEDIITQTDMSVFHLCTSLYRTEVFKKAYWEDTSLFRCKDFSTEDIQVAFIMALNGCIAYLPDFTLNYSTGKPSASQLADEAKQFHFVRSILNVCRYLTEKHHLHSQRLDNYFSRRLFSLAMHAFRAHRKELYGEVVKLEQAWNIHRTLPTQLVMTLMRHEILWMAGLSARKLFVFSKRLLA